MNIKTLIKKVLKEEMISTLEDWENNLTTLNSGEIISTLVSKDDENGDKLYLFVGFTTTKDITEYSYSFILLDKDNQPLTGYETERDVVRKLLPKDIIGKRKLIPVIIEMTKILLDNVLPMEIYRKTVEKLSGDNSLNRYDVITDIMVGDYGYELVNKYVDKFGHHVWKLRRPNGDYGDGLKMEYRINIDRVGVINEVHPLRNIDFTLLKG
tara:strand:+ start:2222 stop:2854 length:633 start_codon:yes stop_codon:yes gene_type:complete